jgi:hypothetical protein
MPDHPAAAFEGGEEGATLVFVGAAFAVLEETGEPVADGAAALDFLCLPACGGLGDRAAPLEAAAGGVQQSLTNHRNRPTAKRGGRSRWRLVRRWGCFAAGA